MEWVRWRRCQCSSSRRFKLSCILRFVVWGCQWWCRSGCARLDMVSRAATVVPKWRSSCLTNRHDRQAPSETHWGTWHPPCYECLLASSRGRAANSSKASWNYCGHGKCSVAICWQRWQVGKRAVHLSTYGGITVAVCRGLHWHCGGTGNEAQGATLLSLWQLSCALWCGHLQGPRWGTALGSETTTLWALRC